ncbi:GtrA family protein [Sinorhizobium psoraleae]|uniref:GtrA family protein n=1 Tax=Sinorhizobium psoraleae TaxID=520838 RepID=A0ABT4KPQ1_9HYPH|nr:GtrA family protein [Sinorhizobium psoraleae]MCZ4093956.1 GtrA family protein [Sinorhizobium psoraleae]
MRNLLARYTFGRQEGADRLLRFATVGAVTTTLDFVLFTGLFAVGAAPGQANILSYSCGILVSYMLNRSWTFRARHSQVQALKFVLGTLTGLVISTCLVALLARLIPPPLAKILSVPVVFAWNYLVALLWVFRT